MLVGKGLGADLRVDCSTGNTIDCDSWSNFFNQTCWGLCSAGGTNATSPVGTPASPVTNCSQTILPTLGVCDSYIYISMMGIAGLLIMRSI